MRHISIRDEYRPTFGRQNLTIWSGAFASDFEGAAHELPGHNGYMVQLDDGGTFRVLCDSPRTEHNYNAVDAAIRAAIADHFTPRSDDFPTSGGHHGQGPEYSEEPAVCDGAW